MIINRTTLGRVLRRAVILKDTLEDMRKTQRRRRQKSYAEYAFGDAVTAVNKCIEKIEWVKAEFDLKAVLDAKHD